MTHVGRSGGAAIGALRLIVPAAWIGIVVALAFIETPLKFQAPGMTLELALGLGRLVLTAADIASAALLIVTTTLALWRPRAGIPSRWAIAGLWVVLVAQIGIVRPLLNAQTDLVLAGAQPAGSSLHIVYIVADVALLGLLVALLVLTAREYRDDARR